MKSPTVPSPVPKKAHKYSRSRPKPGHIPRPPNHFILWRAAFCKEQKNHATGKLIPQSIVSKEAGLIWASLPAAQKSFWVNEAKKAKQAHMEKYPDYKFSPSTKGKQKKNAPLRGENSAQNVDPSVPPIAQNDTRERELTTTVSTTSRSRPSGSRISRVVAEVRGDEQNAPPPVRNHLPQPTRTTDSATSSPAIARRTTFRRPSPLPTSPQSLQNPPRLSRPLRATQPTADPVYDTYSYAWYPMIPNLPVQDTYDYSGTGRASATQAAPPSDLHASSSLWPPPVETFYSNVGTAQDYEAACDTGQFDLQAEGQENLPALPLPSLSPPPQPQETYQVLYHEPPIPDQWQFLPPPVVPQNEWIRPELYKAVPWDPYVDAGGGGEEEWAEASGSSAQLYYGAN